MKGGSLHGGPSFMLFISALKRHGLGMRTGIRLLMVVLLMISLWCGWIFLRPYDSAADQDAPWKVLSVAVKRDHGYFWVRSKLRVVADVPLPQSILLHTKNRRIRSADCIRDKNAIDHISFWVEESDLQGTCELELNGKRYLLKSDGAFSLPNEEQKVFRNPNWR